MIVTVLEAAHYPHPPARPGERRFGGQTLRMPNPLWADIERAIRRLDRDEWPHLLLHIDEAAEREPFDNVFSIMGGRGEYALCLHRDGEEIRYFDVSRPGDDVEIWESDQGSACCQYNLCNDLNLVLRLIRHFAETGALNESVVWSKS
jgi:hypothetical protein